MESIIVEPGSFGTEIADKLIKAEDTAVLASYGELAEIPVRNFQKMGKFLATPEAPRPQLVADAIKKLIDTPKGKRPLRTVVGPLTVAGIDTLNHQYLTARDKLYAEMGLSEAQPA